jgi:hypothetical protein
MTAVACLVCDKPATRWCDATVGIFNHGEKILRSINPPAEDIVSCDAPCCDAHAHYIGMVCGKHSDSVDYCHAHKDLGDFCDWTLSREQLKAARHQAWAECRRYGVRLRNPAPGACDCFSSAMPDGSAVKLTCAAHVRGSR